MIFFHQLLTTKTYGGANTTALNIAAALRGRGRHSYVWLPGEGAAMAKAKELGITWHQYDPTRALASSRMGSVLCNFIFGRQLYSYGPGLIHVHAPHMYRVLLPALKASRLKTVVHVQLEETQIAWRWAFKTPPHVIITCARFLTEHVRNTLPEHLQKNQSIVAVPNAVDSERFHPGDKMLAKQQVGAPVNHPLILLVANLAPHKGHETGIRAVAILKEKGVAAQLWFAGTDRSGGLEYQERLQSLSSELGIADRVRFLGERNDVPDLLRAADSLILPSTAEGLPLSILEAQASKVPVLAAPTAGIPEIITDGQSGFLVRADDAAGYAHYLNFLLRNPSISSQIADCAYTKVLRDHSWKTYMERTFDVYNTLFDLW
jgi:glycosyltransferase involved in cell wall biosynthesis